MSFFNNLLFSKLSYRRTNPACKCKGIQTVLPYLNMKLMRRSRNFLQERSRTRGYKAVFSCSTQLSMKIQLLVRTKMLKNIYFSAFKLFDITIIMPINAIVGI